MFFLKKIQSLKSFDFIKPTALLIVAIVAAFSFFVKASAPTILSILPSSGSQAGGDTVTITGTNFQTAPSVMFGGNPATSVTLQSETVITAKVPAHSPGKVNVTVINTDGQYALIVDGYTYNYPPTITSVSPNTGSTQGGDIIMIKGANFFGTPTIRFGDTLAASITVDGSDALSVTTPAHSAGMVDITLTNPDGQYATLVAAFTFSDSGSTDGGVIPVDLSGGAVEVPTATTTTTTSPTTENVSKTYKTTETTYGTMANPSPTITSVSPSTGNRFGGDSVTITGTNFVNTPTVTFGGVNALSTIYQSSTTLVVTTPTNNTGGAVNVVVINPDAQSATLTNGFTYLTAAPTISSITPNTGTTAGGTYITIAGTGFYGTPTLTIGGSSATSITVRSANKITAYTPAHAAGAVNVVLTNQDTQGVTATNGFTYASFGNPAPTISLVSPSSGTTGTAITITGTNFLTGPAVKINGVNATGVTFVNSTSITANAPSNSAGTYDVTVTNSDGQIGTLTNGFTYLTTPTAVTYDATNITTSSATLNAIVSSTGGENPTRYIEWGTSPGTYSNSCNQGTGTGSYSCAISNLTNNTAYYFRAKVTNSTGTSYGQEKTFSTVYNSGIPMGAETLAYLKLDRITAQVSTGGTVCANPSAVGTEASVVVSFPEGFTVNQTASNWTVTTTNLPNGAVAWPGINTASSVSNLNVTFPSSDLTVGQLYCFNFSSTNTLTNSTAGNDKIGSIATLTSGALTINSSQYAVAIISGDQIILSATVLPTLNVQLQAGTDNFTSALSTSVVTKTNGRTLTIATNADNGWVAWIKSANAGLSSTSSSATIATVGSIDNTPTDLSATTGYLLGVDVTTDSTTGDGAVSQNSGYGAEYKSLGNLNLGGTLSSIFQPIAASDGTTGGDVLTITEKAKITSVQAAATDYTDTLTVVVGGRF